MTCKNYTTTFRQYMEGLLQEQDLQDFQEHIKGCPGCKKAYNEFSHMQEILTDAMNTPNQSREKFSEAIANTDVQVLKPRQSFPIFKYGAVAAVFLAIGIFISNLRPEYPAVDQKPLAMKISQLQGEVLVKHTWEERWKKLTAEESLYKGDAFLALHEGALVLSLNQENIVALNENSSLNIVEYNGQTEFEIPYGTVKATLNGPHEPFFISTPQGRFEALGTEFIVRVR